MGYCPHKGTEFSGDGRHDHLFATSYMLQSFRHGAQVAHAIVDDGNGFASTHSEPFVDGIRPAMRSSGVTAMRKARPKALKMVSA